MLEKEKQNSFKVKFEYLDKTFHNNPKESIIIADMLLQQVTVEKDEAYYLRLLYIKMSSFYTMDSYEETTDEAIKLLDIASNIGNKNYIVKAHNTFGNLYLSLDLLDEAMDSYNTAIKVNNKIEDKDNESRLLNNIGEVYNRLGSFEKALDYYNLSLEVCNEVNEVQGAAISYLNMGDVYQKIGDYENAKKYLVKALEMSNQVNDFESKMHYASLYGEICFKEENWLESIKYYEESLSLANTIDNKGFRIKGRLQLSKINMKLNKYNLAIEHAITSITIAEEFGLNQNVSDAYEVLSEIHEKKDDLEKALFYSRNYFKNSKIIDKENYERVLRGVNIKFKMEQIYKEKEIFRLNNVELQEKNNELESLHNGFKIISEIGQDITATLNLNDILFKIYSNIAKLMDTTMFGIALYDKETGMVEYKSFLECGKRVSSHGTHVSDASSLASWCVRNNKPILSNEISKDYNLYSKGTNKYLGEITESIIFSPLRFENEVIGVITVQSNEPNAYKDIHLDTLTMLGSYIAIAITNSQKSYLLKQEIVENQKVRNDLESLNKKLESFSYIDPLTGISNRRRAIEFLSFELNRSIRNRSTLTVMILDIDFYKQYNDTYGHNAGDICLKRIAEILRNTLKRKIELVARYGGDEFLVIISDSTTEQSRNTAELLRNNIYSERIEHISSIHKYITVTIGCVCLVPADGSSIENIIHLADEALYMAKSKGRNRVSIIEDF